MECETLPYLFLYVRCIIADNDLTDFNGFLTIMAKRMSAPEPDDQLLEAFRIFDKEGEGYTME